MSCGHWFESPHGWVGGWFLGSWCIQACKLIMKAAPFGRTVGDDGGKSWRLERNEDRKVQCDICERQAAFVCGVDEAYDGGVGALERRDECGPS